MVEQTLRKRLDNYNLNINFIANQLISTRVYFDRFVIFWKATSEGVVQQNKNVKKFLVLVVSSWTQWIYCLDCRDKIIYGKNFYTGFSDGHTMSWKMCLHLLLQASPWHNWIFSCFAFVIFINKPFKKNLERERKYNKLTQNWPYAIIAELYGGIISFIKIDCKCLV